MNEGLDQLAERLRSLYLDLEERKDFRLHYTLARALEDRIGAGQHSPGDIEKAEDLLTKYRF